MTKSLQGLVNSFAATMDIANFNINEPPTPTMFDDLGMSSSARNTVACLGKATACSLTGWLVGYAKNLRKEGRIRSQSIGKKCNIMPIS